MNSQARLVLCSSCQCSAVQASFYSALCLMCGAPVTLGDSRCYYLACETVADIVHCRAVLPAAAYAFYLPGQQAALAG